MRRLTRLSNAFGKKLDNRAHMVAFYALWYNFVRVHKTPRTSPAMAAGIETRLWSMKDVVRLIERLWGLESRASETKMEEAYDKLVPTPATDPRVVDQINMIFADSTANLVKLV
jgi:hypothetical protein